MSGAEVIEVVAIGFAAGVTSGMLGVGGGILFVPGLVIFLGETQLRAEATSLLAIVPVALVGAWRQHGYGNLRLRDGLVVGGLAPLGVLAGTALANALPERGLELAFAAVQIFFAVNLARRGLARTAT
ncbi:MAG: uncharacterized protein QOE08_206 [Thermoleophilaceae bacterium]|jgi:uncharacterized membrane protein YfcA|nr:uncharacterized protein [Thermoleophilaceae bacterium]